MKKPLILYLIIEIILHRRHSFIGLKVLNIMKEKKHRSKNHSKKEEKYSRHAENKHADKLKIKYNEDGSNSKDDISKFQKDRMQSNKIHRNHTRSPSRSASRKKENYKPHKKEDSAEESYEELSRKKRKIEYELRALELEEAASKKGKVESRKSKHNIVKVKEERTSDDEGPRSSNASVQNRRLVETKEDNRSKQPDANSWGQPKEETKKVEKEKPNFTTSGKLAEDTNVYKGVVIKYNEPSEARKPQRRWRLYPFKGDDTLPFIPIHRQSAYLFGRTRAIADIPIDHPSCSKQHAVLQFRLIPYKRDDGTTGRRVRPYIIDLESSNGTFLNNKRIDPRCYVELVEKDVIKFGYSSREYVILHEESKENDDDDIRD